MRDLHRLVVLVQEEVLLPETRHETAGRIGDRDVDVDQLDAALEAEAVLRLGARANLPIGRDQRNRGSHRGGEHQA